jgi:hypothetical protein
MFVPFPDPDIPPFWMSDPRSNKNKKECGEIFFVTKHSKILVWDLGSEIRDPGS